MLMIMGTIVLESECECGARLLEADVHGVLD